MKRTEEETGGQAFPSDSDYGMTLRDYFASLAMQALISAVDAEGGKLWDEDEVASLAYYQAYEMLRARDAE